MTLVKRLLKPKTMVMECDILIVGGGVIGCSLLYELTSKGYQCLLVEKNEHLITGASCGNSGQVHTGFDNKLDADGKQTLEARCMKHARVLNEAFYKENKLPWKQTGALLVAWTKTELDQFPSIIANSCKNGLDNIQQLSVDQIRQMEPHLSHDVLGALLVPGESVVDPWLAPVTMVHKAKRLGGQILCSCKVLSGKQEPDKSWIILTSSGPIRAQTIINAAGLYGDTVEDICHKSSFRIRPIKGQFAVFDQAAGHLLKHIILPVPSEMTKGILLFPTVYGNIVVGPTADDVESREDLETDQSTIDKLVNYAYKTVPRLKDHKVVTTYAGIRPASQHKDYQIRAYPKRHWITVGGIRSTGLTSCLAISKYVQELVQKRLQHFPVKSFVPSKSCAEPRLSNSNTVVFDGTEYKITHPLSRLGVKSWLSKL